MKFSKLDYCQYLLSSQLNYVAMNIELSDIGMVSCVYVNAQSGQFWVIDYRIYNPDGDGKAN